MSATDVGMYHCWCRIISVKLPRHLTTAVSLPTAISSVEQNSLFSSYQCISLPWAVWFLART